MLKFRLAMPDGNCVPSHKLCAPKMIGFIITLTSKYGLSTQTMSLPMFHGLEFETLFGLKAHCLSFSAC